MVKCVEEEKVVFFYGAGSVADFDKGDAAVIVGVGSWDGD